MLAVGCRSCWTGNPSLGGAGLQSRGIAAMDRKVDGGSPGTSTRFQGSSSRCRNMPWRGGIIAAKDLGYDSWFSPINRLRGPTPVG